MVQRLVAVQIQRGFSYVIAMFLVAVLSVIALQATQITVTKERRQQEARLIEVGTAYQRAIRSYVENSPGTIKTYPPTLAALLVDDRTGTLRRHLRKLYRDPITGEPFGLIRTESGEIQGVFSTSNRSPIKQNGFPEELTALAKAKRYSDWHFLYVEKMGVALGDGT